MSENKLPNVVDRHVGRRIRWRRRELKLSQEKLGTLLGLTFQQVQKYERGVNRVSAGRLYEMSEAMTVPITYFFDGIEEIAELAERVSEVHEGSGDGMEVLDKLDRDALELLAAFQRIPDQKLRKSLLATVQSAAAAFAQEEDDQDGK